MSSFIIDTIQTIPAHQKASLTTQYQQILMQIDRRLRSAINSGNKALCAQLEEERRTILSRLA